MVKALKQKQKADFSVGGAADFVTISAQYGPAFVCDLKHRGG
jgi:hypothetical protein